MQCLSGEFVFEEVKWKFLQITDNSQRSYIREQIWNTSHNRKSQTKLRRRDQWDVEQVQSCYAELKAYTLRLTS